MGTRMDVTALEFGNGYVARVARPGRFADVAPAVAGLGFRGRRPVLVVVGDAAGLDEAGKKRLTSLFDGALVPFVTSWKAAVVDGGTDSGVMQLLGQARAAAKDSFPLVGVAAEKMIMLPGSGGDPADRVPLERHHSHFVLVPGSSWGDESPWLAWVATAVADGASSVTVLINGGDIAFQDVAHSLDANRPVLVIAGTGRTADRIAAGIDGGRTGDQAAQLASSPLVTVVCRKNKHFLSTYNLRDSGLSLVMWTAYRQARLPAPAKAAHTCRRCRKPVSNGRERWGWLCEDCERPLISVSRPGDSSYHVPDGNSVRAVPAGLPGLGKQR